MAQEQAAEAARVDGARRVPAVEVADVDREEAHREREADVGDQQPRLLGSVAHRLLEDYLQETVRTGARPPLARVAATAAGLLEDGGMPGASGDLIREAAELVSRWLAQWTVPLESVVAVERALAVDRHGTHVDWDAPDAGEAGSGPLGGAGTPGYSGGSSSGQAGGAAPPEGLWQLARKRTKAVTAARLLERPRSRANQLLLMPLCSSKLELCAKIL